jgi:hypothetical protein
LDEIQNKCGTVMVTAPVRLLNDRIEHDLNDSRMKRWLAGIGHMLHLTWLEIEEGKAFWNLQMNRAIFGNNEGNYTTTYCGVKANLTPHLVCFHAGFMIRAPRQGRQARLKKIRSEQNS